MDYEIHPLCKILPEMTNAEYKALVSDIKAKGLKDAITLYDGMILDGRNRFNACRDAGVKPRFVEYDGNDPAGFVASSCLHRSLNQSQRALIAAGFLEYEREQARKRQIELAGTRKSDLKENLPEGMGQARDRAGARMDISGKTVTIAAQVKKDAAPVVLEMVRSGDMALNEAKDIVRLNKDAQSRLANIADKKERRRETEKALNRSSAAIKRDAHRAAPKEDEKHKPKFSARFLGRMRSMLAGIREDMGNDEATQDEIVAAVLSGLDQSDVTSLQMASPLLGACAVIWHETRKGIAA